MSCSKMASPEDLSRQIMQPNGPQTQIVTNIFTKKVENMILTNSSVHTNANYEEPHKKGCSVHKDRSVDFLCVLCDAYICQLCKMSEHEGHETKSISLAAEEAKRIWMSVSSNCIRLHEHNVKNIMEETKVQMQDLVQTARTTESKINERFDHLQCLINSSESSTLLANIFEERLRWAQIKMQQKKRAKFNSVSKLNFDESMPAIHLRQNMLLGMMNKQKEQQLEQLTAMKNEASTELAEFVKNMEEELDAIAHLQEKMDAAIDEKDHVAILNLTRQMKVEFSAQLLRNRLSKLSPAFQYTFDHRAEDINENDVISNIFWSDQKVVVETYIQNFLGHAVNNLVPARKGVEGIAVDLKPAFRCSEESHAVVKSICPCGDRLIMVSFATHPNEVEGITKTFNLSGQEQFHSFGLGSLSTMPKSQNGLTIHFLPAYSEYGSVSTSVSLNAKHNKHYVLKTSSEKTKCCFHFYLTYKDKSDTVMEALVDKHTSTMNNCTTTAFDASSSGESFAVVNIIPRNTYNLHGFHDGVQFIRALLILDRTCDGSLKCYTYEPPTPAFSPTDVCFFDVNGEEGLAVADMGTNSIHLSCRSSDSGKYVFTRYLIENHQLLTCPTAVNTDTLGRLWVACKGGRLLTMELKGT